MSRAPWFVALGAKLVCRLRGHRWSANRSSVKPFPGYWCDRCKRFLA